MKKKVKVSYLPKAVVGMQVTGKINNKDGSVVTGGFAPLSSGQGMPGVEVNRTLKPTTKENATLEAEKGETVMTNLTQGGIPEFYTIGGKRHHAGGTPLNLPSDSFIFSRDNKMKIKDKDILAQFGQGKKKGQKGFTPAELSKKFDLNPFRKILADPSSDHFQIKTAEMMIQNYNLKLGGLALAQESIKGFPNGIPGVAMPYLENVGIDPASLIPKQEQQQLPQARYGGSQWSSYAPGGSFPGVDDEGGVDLNTVPAYANYNFQGLGTDTTAIDNYYASLLEAGENVNREDFFNAWNNTPGGKQLPYSTDLNPSPTGTRYAPIRQVSAPAPTKPKQRIRFFHSTPGEGTPYGSQTEVQRYGGIPSFYPGGETDPEKAALSNPEMTNELMNSTIDPDKAWTFAEGEKTIYTPEMFQSFSPTSSSGDMQDLKARLQHLAEMPPEGVDDAWVQSKFSTEDFYNAANKFAGTNIQYVGDKESGSWDNIQKQKERTNPPNTTPFTPQTRYVEAKGKRSGYWEGKQHGKTDSWKALTKRNDYLKKYDKGFDADEYAKDEAGYMANFNAGVGEFANVYNNPTEIDPVLAI
jgi:hypothetical protein